MRLVRKDYNYKMISNALAINLSSGSRTLLSIKIVTTVADGSEYMGIFTSIKWLKYVFPSMKLKGDIVRHSNNDLQEFVEIMEAANIKGCLKFLKTQSSELKEHGCPVCTDGSEIIKL